MSVATKNPFALLESEDSPSTSSPAAKATTKAPQASAPPANRGSQKTRGGPASRGGKYYARGGGARQSPRDSNQTGADDAVGGEPKKFDGRGRGRGGGGGRGGAGRGRGRPFDRHSQTGKTDSDKKVQQSWGGADGDTELKAEQQANVDAAVEGKNDWDDTGAADWGTAPADAPADAAPAEGDKPEGRPRREREPEEEDNTLTLDQYLAQQKEKDSAVPKLEGVRQVNDNADTWKDAVALSKDNEDSYFVGKSKSAPKPKAKKEERVFIEIDARFERPERGGRGRGRGGDRGGDRARGGRGAGRGGARGGRQPNQAAVNVDDQAAFPSLA